MAHVPEARKRLPPAAADSARAAAAAARESASGEQSAARAPKRPRADADLRQHAARRALENVLLEQAALRGLLDGPEDELDAWMDARRAEHAEVTEVAIAAVALAPAPEDRAVAVANSLAAARPVPRHVLRPPRPARTPRLEEVPEAVGDSTDGVKRGPAVPEADAFRDVKADLDVNVNVDVCRDASAEAMVDADEEEAVRIASSALLAAAQSVEEDRERMRTAFLEARRRRDEENPLSRVRGRRG